MHGPRAGAYVPPPQSRYQDEEDLSDLDIFDITNPRRPRMVSELDLNQFGVAQPELNLAARASTT